MSTMKELESQGQDYWMGLNISLFEESSGIPPANGDKDNPIKWLVNMDPQYWPSEAIRARVNAQPVP